MQNNKRRLRRYNLEVPVKYYVRGNQAASGMVTSDNISAGGVGITGNTFIPPATNLMIQFMLAKRCVCSIGKVAWVNISSRSSRYRMGVEFLEMNPLDRKYLKTYLSVGNSPEEQ